jgi:ATP-dependent RNA helicase SUPV3L1/SUV3
VSGNSHDTTLKAVLGPTNTGKTHLAIERMCGHSSGAIGFPLRLLAREVYERVKAIKGEAQVALITGEERIEPPDARYLLCTVEAMPVGRFRTDRPSGEARSDAPAFVALDEAQLAADPERGHIFTDRLLHVRGREETMLLGSATLAPMVKALLPGTEITQRPRFSTLTCAGIAKLSRLPPRSAVVGFSAEQVYAVAEMLRRFRGGAAVVMGALSPETRNRQVELFQSGEVDYIVATDAIGMGLNLDVAHVAFASLTKFDGRRKRRLMPAEMAQIAGRAGRHQKDGTFGTLSGLGSGLGAELTAEEIYAIENHRFAPLTQLFWREAEPRFDSPGTLIADLQARPDHPALAPAPEAIDLAVLRRLAEQEDLAATLTDPAQISRFWAACQLPDFRQQGPDMHARFVARLWRDLKGGMLGADYVPARIGELDNVQGDIDTLQGRIAAIRSWAYICQRPDWVAAREEMAARARRAEARLSDALHERLTERFVNRRSSVLMKAMAKDPGLRRVTLDDGGTVRVEGEAIGHLEGFRFVVDRKAGHEDQRLMLAAAERHLPELLARRAQALLAGEVGELRIAKGAVLKGETEIAQLESGKDRTRPRLLLGKEVAGLPGAQRARLFEALELWLAGELSALEPLRRIEEAAARPDMPGEIRALLLGLIGGNGAIRREEAGLINVPKDKRPLLRKLGVTIGALDIFVPALLKPAPRAVLQAIGADRRPLREGMEPVIAQGKGPVPAGYRRAGSQAIRVDMAEKLFRAAHELRSVGGAREFRLDPALATSMGLQAENFARLMRDAGFTVQMPRKLAHGAFGPPAPPRWRWRPPRKDHARRAREGRSPVPKNNAFSALAGLLD